MQNEVIELGMLDGWMLGAEKENGRLLESRLFLVTELLPTNLPEFTARIARVNQLSSVGRGYVFQAFEEPCLGCEVMVQPGWPSTDSLLSLGGLFVVSVLASLLPAWRAYRLSLMDGLHPPSV